MKNLFAVIICVLISFSMLAQNRKALQGKGAIISQKQTVSSFDEVEIYGMDGQVEIEISEGVQVELSYKVDENLQDLLKYEINNKTLKLFVKGNRNNVLYLENTHIAAKIICPSLKQVRYEGNADIRIIGLNQSDFVLKKEGNGDMILSGKVGNLTVFKEGNGKIDANALRIENAKITAFGNGNILLNASADVAGTLNGNGFVKNMGEGETKGTALGNGKFISKKRMEEINATPLQRVNITFVNESMKKREYYVKGMNEGGSSFSYGLELGPLASQSETLPLGTEIFWRGKCIATLKAADNGQKVKL